MDGLSLRFCCRITGQKAEGRGQKWLAARVGASFQSRNALPLQSEPMTLTIEHDVPLAPFTTLGIGGPAELFLRAASGCAIPAGPPRAHAHGHRGFFASRARHP